MNIIELDHITKSYGNHIAVDDLSLQVPKGSIYGFIGPNGSGKTTTIRMIMNILYPDNGVIRIFGKEHVGSHLDNIGYLPEERGLYRKMKVKELVSFYGELKQIPKPAKEADYWLEKFDLKNWAGKKVEALSKGMSQKLQFIITIISRPGIIILDEPFSGLDPVNAEIIKEVILDLRKEGATVLFSTHDMAVAERMCDFIFMIYNGKKVLDGTLESIQKKYGQDTIRVQTDGGALVLQGISGIEKINDFGQIQEVKMSSEADNQMILSAIMKKTRIKKFEITSPSLNDIFIRIARPEKSERIAEVLLGSVTPWQFMAGKILGSLGVSLTTSAIYIAGAVVTLNRMDLSGIVPYHVIPWFFIYMFLNIIMVGSIMAALGATCNDSKDAQAIQFPAMLPIIIPLFLMMPIILNPMGKMAIGFSLFPLWTPMLMLLRQSTSVTIPIWQPVVGLIGVILFTILCVWGGARIFRATIILQGKRPKLGTLLRYITRG